MSYLVILILFRLNRVELRLLDRATGMTLYEQGVAAEDTKQDAYLIISEDIPVSSYVIERAYLTLI